MPNQLDRTIRQEAQWVQQFSSNYRSKLAELIDRVNRSLAAPGQTPDWQSVRWCIEAVDLVLASQAEFAKALNQLATAGNGRAV